MVVHACKPGNKGESCSVRPPAHLLHCNSGYVVLPPPRVHRWETFQSKSLRENKLFTQKFIFFPCVACMFHRRYL